MRCGMDLPNGAGDLLAQPTRARLFTALQELMRPASTEELAERVELHVNGVRRQLERLEQAGLLERRRIPHGRGRPRDEWSLAPGASPGGERPRAYADLARWLARAIAPGPGRLRQVERTGREIGRELTPSAGGDAVEAFDRALTALGFRPASEIDADGRLCCRLGNCPYRDAARESAEVVCTLHRGITAGLLDELAPRARLVRFEPHDPDRAGCLIEVIGDEWGAGQPDPAARAASTKQRVSGD
jgi:predicted ArsR family transcriptional regulator